MNIIQQLHESPWKGIINEVGVGLEFAPMLIRELGATKTVLAVHSDYAGLTKPASMRAVSLDYARLTSWRGQKEYQDYANKHDSMPTNHLFSLAITGAHYKDRISHAWVCLKTESFEAYMHVNITYVSEFRETIGKRLAEAVLWFLEGTLLQTRSWRELIICKPEYIDVLYAPGVSDIERLGLLNSNEPLLYHNGKFQRTIDYLRDAEAIYAGSFNPPHKDHLEIGKGSLFRINTHAYGKGFTSAEDLLHRMKMLDLCNVPVLISATNGLFYQEDHVYRKLWNKDYVYRVGSDTWNRVINAREYPNENYLAQAMGGSSFEITERAGVPIENNPMSLKLHAGIVANLTKGVCSTDARKGDLSMVPEDVATYIKRHGLYGQLPESD